MSAPDPNADLDPRIARTRRDVVDAAIELLRDEGWEAVTHARVAQTSGYSKATVYAHWPARLDLVRDAVDRICSEDRHPRLTGDLRTDLVAGLTDFAGDLAEGRLSRLLGGLLERAGDPTVDDLRGRLYAFGTGSLRAALEAHLEPADVEPVVVMLTGGVLVRSAFAGEEVNGDAVRDLVDRALRTVVRAPADS